MLLSTVVAVALGVAPIKQDGSVTGDYSRVIGRYTQTIDNKGTKRARGFNRLTGAPYDVAVDSDGNVEAKIGNSLVTFRIRDAS